MPDRSSSQLSIGSFGGVNSGGREYSERWYWFVNFSFVILAICEKLLPLWQNRDGMGIYINIGKAGFQSVSKSDPTRTILTEEEFCSILTKIRTRLRNNDGEERI